MSGSGEIHVHCTSQSLILVHCSGCSQLRSRVGRDSEEGINEAETRNIADIMTAFKFIVNVCCYVHVHVIFPATSCATYRV